MTHRPVFHHVNLKTTRLDEMIEWYRLVVGLDEVFRFAGGAWLTNDTANHRLALGTSSGVSEDPDKVAHAGLHHTAFEYAALEELLATYVRLKAEGIHPHFAVDHGMTTSFYYLDPDDNSVELQVDNFGDWHRSTEWMRTAPEFAANPVGTLIDPERLVAAQAAGLGPDEIHERGYAGEYPPVTPMDLLYPL